MAVVRATALSNFPEVVRGLGGDPDLLLLRAGLDPTEAGRPDVFIPLGKAVAALEIAATATATPDFGRRLGAVPGIDILGPVGVAARTARTVAEALQIFERFMAAYSPGIAVRVREIDMPGRSLLEYQIPDHSVPASPQHAKLALGVIPARPAPPPGESVSADHGPSAARRPDGRRWLSGIFRLPDPIRFVGNRIHHPHRGPEPAASQ